ncbi:unnamed protein product [Spirodela intermedia]|uniref:Uncharacterized protein n=1 Tax=Spirodela intermedia TaxID=51605 RepID=A0A7I8IML3_SPIIN|nr:unnamed protein product [Spirodela intermedia]CAA6659039.1 unnamed protein product [Spirodela intermedia]
MRRGPHSLFFLNLCRQRFWHSSLCWV